MLLVRRRLLLGSLSFSATALLAGRAFAGPLTVFNGTQLKMALEAARPGSTITLAPGDYGDAGRFFCAASDVTICAEDPSAAVLRDELVHVGDRSTVKGVGAAGRSITVAGNGQSVVGARITGTSGAAIQITTGQGIRVSGCDISGFSGRGIMVKVGGGSQPKDPVIENNHIHDSVGGGDTAEAIQLGQDMKSNAYRLGAQVRSNLLERINGESEAMSIKCSGNTISNNRLLDSRSYIVNRHGDYNIYQGNQVEKAYGIVIHGGFNKVLNNRCVNSILKRSIRIMGGDAPWNSSKQGAHPQAYATLVSGNTADYLVVGDLFPGDHLPAVNTTIVGHHGPIIYKSAIGTKVSGAAAAKGAA